MMLRLCDGPSAWQTATTVCNIASLTRTFSNKMCIRFWFTVLPLVVETNCGAEGRTSLFRGTPLSHWELVWQIRRNREHEMRQKSDWPPFAGGCQTLFLFVGQVVANHVFATRSGPATALIFHETFAIHIRRSPKITGRLFCVRGPVASWFFVMTVPSRLYRLSYHPSRDGPRFPLVLGLLNQTREFDILLQRNVLLPPPMYWRWYCYRQTRRRCMVCLFFCSRRKIWFCRGHIHSFFLFSAFSGMWHKDPNCGISKRGLVPSFDLGFAPHDRVCMLELVAGKIPPIHCWECRRRSQTIVHAPN